ncbi:MAG TPA: dihydroorotate dehydrogenase electron transfer subunit [Bacteroidales bacterium]|jgi:dihydroorotate dehydrogenase electron transfer subunit|nr:dihydroorotate dehydrogenase electron transfer subunit [Bacteroidales bacterium]HPM87541.1 dihydroorotate dehydrogenase electron transfer subunit [Bacteroidales bacterium]HQM68852.1 dihydroorotate dehydrogenase electron transfer subunit [Bacteroidales bacterium]
MTKRIESLRVVENKKLSSNIFVLELTASGRIPEMKPGQFVQVKIDGSPDTFLRRPFSVHDVNYSQNTFRLLIQIAGKGTETLSGLRTGDNVNLIYPLGNSFSLPAKGERILLTGGGCGVAPLLFLGKYLKLNGFVPDILLGFRSRERVIEYDEYSALGKVYLTTEDGSLGTKGFITDHPVLLSNRYDIIYCCGPDLMMKAVAKFCKEQNIRCEVSLENLMGCGIGACLCCIVDTVKGNVCTCTEGPVFNITDLKW